MEEYELAELKQQVEELQRQLWILTQGDNWLKNVKTQPLGTTGGGGPAPGVHTLGGAAHTADTLANLNAKVSDATLDDSGDSRAPSAHSIASHSDTTATGAELETLTDGSDADSLHDHGQFASAAEAIAAVEAEATLDLTGDVTIAAAKSLAVDTLAEKTADAGVTIDVANIRDGIVYPKATKTNQYYRIDITGGATDGDTILAGDDNDYIYYDITANTWHSYIGGTEYLQIYAGGIKADVIGELSADTGVTIDGLLLKDGGVDGVDISDQVPVCKWDATAGPGVTNDVDEGYKPGSTWVDVTNDDAYICLDNTDGAAVWKKMTP